MEFGYGDCTLKAAKAFREKLLTAGANWKYPPKKPLHLLLEEQMKNISEYDKRQLRLMHENLISFEKKQMELGFLVGGLEFLLNALESVDEEWEGKFLKEIITLETANALTIIKNSGEEVSEIEKDKKEALINKSIENLKKLIDSEQENK